MSETTSKTTQKYIRVEDIPKVSSPWHDYGVRQYTAKEIAEEYLKDLKQKGKADANEQHRLPL